MSDQDAPVIYTAAQVRDVLARTGQLMTAAAGYDPLDGCVPVRDAYIREEITRPLNAAADAISGSHEYECSASLRKDDQVNLSVNITGWLLDHLDRIGTATIEEIIEDSYSTGPAEVLGWVS